MCICDYVCMCMEARRGCWASSCNCLPIPFEARSLPEPGACSFSSRLEASKSELEL